jgi:O-succinylbenzoic acid--CoA ligase
LRARANDLPLVVHERFDVHRFAAERRPTLVSLVPTQLVRLLDAGADLSRYRAILLGGGAAPAGLLDRAAATGARVVTTYGMSETCGGCVYDGRPLDGVDVRTDAEGRIHLRGAVVMREYRLSPGLTAEALVDGWLRTADVGEWDGERLTVHGRLDDVVVTGGEKVHAGQVAALLATHPAVRDVVVVGVPDAEWGE